MRVDMRASSTCSGYMPFALFVRRRYFVAEGNKNVFFFRSEVMSHSYDAPCRLCQEARIFVVKREKGLDYLLSESRTAGIIAPVRCSVSAAVNA